MPNQSIFMLASKCLVIDLPADHITAADRARLTHPLTGGVILFARNVGAPAQVRALTDQIRAINPALFIGIDQEGGRVARLKSDFTPLPAMGKLGALFAQNQEKALQLAQAIGTVMATETRAVGVDISFAPVLDLNNGSLVIGDRAFSAVPSDCQALAAAFVVGMNQAKMIATGKHFPGHGSVLDDSHTHAPIDTRALSEMADLSVFTHMLPKLAAIMPAHVIYSQIDSKPAGFSAVWLQTILRQQMGFAGAIFSDDLSMQAAAEFGTMTERVAAAAAAGCDYLLICNDVAAVDEVLATFCADTSLPATSLPLAPLPSWHGDLATTCAQVLGGAADYAAAKQLLENARAELDVGSGGLIANWQADCAMDDDKRDPTDYC